MLAAVGTAGAAALGGQAIASAQATTGKKGGGKPPKKGPIRVSISVSVANDLNRLNDGITQLVERLGCRLCFSGFDCHFRVESGRKPHFQIAAADKKVKVSAPDPDGDPARTVSVKLAPQVSGDIRQVKAALAKVMGKLGCRGCCSGFDISFQQAIRTLSVDKALDVKESTLKP